MQRAIFEKIVEWKNSKNRKPLILRGARQIGKTYLINEFGNKYFKNSFHKLDLEKFPVICKIFEKDFDIKRIISELEIFLQKKIDLKNDLLFIDEIQNCKNGLASLRYFYEDCPELNVIAAGSLIEFALKDIAFPVGRVQLLEMFPMNFYEFLLAKGKTLAAEAIISTPNNNSEILHSLLLSELREWGNARGSC